MGRLGGRLGNIRLLVDAACQAGLVIRQLRCQGVVGAVKQAQILPQLLPTSATNMALHHLHNEWDKLIRYPDDGRPEIENNSAKNHPLCSQRKLPDMLNLPHSGMLECRGTVSLHRTKRYV